MFVWLPYASLSQARDRLGPLPEGIEAAVACRSAGLPEATADRVEFFALPNFEVDLWPRVLALEPPRLRWLQLASAGWDYIIDSVPERIGLVNAAGVHDTGTAELAVALALACLNGLDRYARDRVQERFAPADGDCLAGKRCLIVGYGRIGQAVEKRLRGFEAASVSRVARRARTDPEVHAAADLPALLPAADVVFVTAPATPETAGLLGAAALALLPDRALVVNVGRGAVVDTAALTAEVACGRLRAALDVTDPEPLPAGHPLWRLDGVTWSPHVGGRSGAFPSRYDRFLACQLQRLADGQDPDNIVRYPT
ncbi:MAG: dihydrofolate reductase [Propionibacteriaceae bacterium]|jgi:phosphoglycerate dehydrogenase-like enzyme|nr:dihydrofolate reductase [Propionibacteriaceae bacterium]